jgi:hypothetical protein
MLKSSGLLANIKLIYIIIIDGHCYYVYLLDYCTDYVLTRSTSIWLSYNLLRIPGM